ncbi:MAG: PAS domain S-box protein [Chloroflexaceae bacterium]|nr:PAS domain S-box protein [Chloroflexaceae bacterium]
MEMIATMEQLQIENSALRLRIHQLESALSELQQQEERLRMMLNTATDWTWEVNADGIYTYVSPNITDILGYAVSDVLGKTPFDLMPAEEAERILPIFTSIATNHQPIQHLENIILHHNGNCLVMETSGTPYYDQQGVFAGYRGVDRDITERRYAELERDHLFLLTPDMIGLAGFDGYFKRLNPSWSRVLGWTEEELYEEPFLFFVHPDDLQQTIDTAQNLADGQIIIAFTNRYRCKDGSYRWIEWVSAPVVEQQRIYFVARDITERKQQEEDFRTQQLLFQGILEHAPFAIFAMDPNGRFLVCNPEAAANLNLAPEQVLGKTPDDLFPCEIAHDLWQRHHHVISTGERMSYEMCFAIQPDQPLYFWQSWFAIKDRDGTNYAVAGTITNITERKQHERQILMQQFALDHAQDMVEFLDDTGCLVYANESVCQNVGYTHDELQGMPLSVIDPYFPPEQWVNMWQYLQQHRTTTLETVHRRKDGSTFPVEVSATYLQMADQDLVLGLVRDITQRKQTEAEHMALQQQIITAQQQSLRELSTPLIPIAEGVLVMPLIGAIDSNRAQMVMETVLNGVETHQAKLVILDITGVQVVDTQVANAFIQAARAVKLLGAQMMLTGIQPQIAQTLVTLGVDLGDMLTRSTLQAGIASAFHTSYNNSNGTRTAN